MVLIFMNIYSKECKENYLSCSFLKESTKESIRQEDSFRRWNKMAGKFIEVEGELPRNTPDISKEDNKFLRNSLYLIFTLLTF